MSRTMNGASLIAIAALLLPATALAQDAEPTQETESRLATITVTATKRAESAQDVPVAVNAIGADALEELDVNVFTDYLTQLPGVTAGGGGPGQSTIYIRGVASTTPVVTNAGVAGLAPNVAFYLDEQPLAQPGRNLDVYAADLQRIEVLPGPQGTLFGASSQAGTVRLITNKPDLDAFEAKMNFGTAFTEGGDSSHNLEAVINIPLTDSFAVRGVVYTDSQGGYIDNVPGRQSAIDSARFRPEGAVRDNGLPVAPIRAGFQSTSDLSGVNFEEANNTDLVEKNFNDTLYTGYRLSGLYQINDDWKLTAAIAQQQLDTEGVFFTDPDLDDWEIQRYEEDETLDEYTNVNWTLEGQIGALETVYTGAFTDRDTEQTVDYTDYLFIGQYLPYYICDASVTYPGDAAASGTCYAPNQFVDVNNELEVQTHELRFNTPSEHRLRATFGGFYSDLELKERNDYIYPGSVNVLGFDGVSVGFAPNYPLTNTAVTGEIGNAAPGYFSDPGPFRVPTIFRNDILRTDTQAALFGEVAYDVIPDTLTFTLGARGYDIEVDFEGSANSSFFNLGAATDAQRAGANLSTLFSGQGSSTVDKAATDGVIFKATVDWTPVEDVLFFATYSEGFRPGVLNRPGGRSNADGSYTVPFAVDTDDVKNYEFGWKTTLFDGSFRFNGSAFFIDIQDMQTTIFDPNITNLFFSDNAANAEIMGLESDFDWAPLSIDGLTISGAVSLLDTEVKEVLVPTNDVLAGSPLAFAPEFQGNLRARYEWDMGEYRAHVMPQIVHSGEAYTDIIEINKIKLDSWTTMALSAGVTKDNWRVEVYGNNLSNEAAQYSGNFTYDRSRIAVARPRTYGIRVGVDF